MLLLKNQKGMLELSGLYAIILGLASYWTVMGLSMAALFSPQWSPDSDDNRLQRALESINGSMPAQFNGVNGFVYAAPLRFTQAQAVFNQTNTIYRDTSFEWRLAQEDVDAFFITGAAKTNGRQRRWLGPSVFTALDAAQIKTQIEFYMRRVDSGEKVLVVLRANQPANFNATFEVSYSLDVIYLNLASPDSQQALSSYLDAHAEQILFLEGLPAESKKFKKWAADFAALVKSAYEVGAARVAQGAGFACPEVLLKTP